MKKNLVFLMVTFTMIVWGNIASATLFDEGDLEIRFSISGDIDGLGLQLFPGEIFDWWDLPRGSSGEGIFDALLGGPGMPEISWIQDGFENFEVLAGFGVIGSGGWGGLGFLPELSLNGQEIGQFGDIRSGNRYSIDYFDLTSFTDSLEQETLEFSFNTPHSSGWWDTGALDFAIVGVVGTATPAPVPEPATILLIGTGLVGIVGVHRRKKI